MIFDGGAYGLETKDDENYTVSCFILWVQFVIGILVSLFLLPCSSGPYFVVLGLLKSENVSIAGLGI